ncbi:hypothetical protein C8F01DRAFT_1141386 [Mycena amicta]|nr:hypothetical protein C8F01DRAFT_1141386 [Mycena amicta]
MDSDPVLLLGPILEAGFFGVYAVLFVTVVYLFRSRDRRPPNVVAGGLVAQFVLITAHWGYNLYLIFGVNSRPSHKLLVRAIPGALLSQATAVITNLLVIHRVYVIFACRLPLVVPSLVLVLGQVASGSGYIYSIVKSNDDPTFAYSLSNPWFITMLVASILISVSSTVMISWIILRVNPSFQRIGGGVPLTTALANIAESAALQTTITIGMLVTYPMGTLSSICRQIMPVIFGVSTVLIYARIGLGWAHGTSNIAGSLPTRINFSLPQDSEDALESDERK